MDKEFHAIADLLIRKMGNHPMTDAETQRLQAWSDQDSDNARLIREMQDPDWLEKKLFEKARVDKEAIWKPVAAYLTAEKKGAVVRPHTKKK